MELSLKSRIFARARELGFDAIGVARAEPTPHAAFLEEWVARGFAGEMNYMTRDLLRRQDPQLVLPGAKSVVVVALSYFTENKENDESRTEHREASGTNPADSSHNLSSIQPATLRGTIARYAHGDDYHLVMQAKLESLAAFIRQESPTARAKIYVDTGPILERELAQQAGIGFVGKSTILIRRDLGTWFFLGEILIDLELEPDTPQKNFCGTCVRCIEACPTGAIVAPFQLDARRCISYLTIELKGPIPRELRPLIGWRIFGCDDCLEVCPWNRFARLSREASFQPRHFPLVSFPKTQPPKPISLTAPDLLELFSLDDQQFNLIFRESPLKRIKRRGFLRNVCVALGNAGDCRAVPALSRVLEDSEPLVRGHAAWALGRLGGDQTAVLLREKLAVESDLFVREELLLAIQKLCADSANRD